MQLKKLRKDKRLKRRLEDTSKAKELITLTKDLSVLQGSLDWYRRCRASKCGGLKFTHLAEAEREVAMDIAKVYISLEAVTQICDLENVEGFIEYHLCREEKERQAKKW